MEPEHAANAIHTILFAVPMKTSFCSVWHAALIAVMFAPAVAALVQDLAAAPPNYQKLAMERHLTLAPQPRY